MRLLTISSLCVAALVSSNSFAQNQQTLDYNMIQLQADASREIANDQMQVSMYIEKNHKQPTVLATEINQAMNQALTLAQKYPTVKVETGSQTTSPVYDTDNRKLKEWRSHAQVRLQSTDFKATSALMAELQQSFQVQSLNFTVSDTQRKKVENELMIEASKNFQQRAQSLAQAWNKSGYQVVNIHINTSQYHAQPRVAMAMMKNTAMADSVPEQNMATGESSLNVSVNGSIQLK